MPTQSPLFGQTSGLSIPPAGSSYSLVSQAYYSRTQSYYTYRATLVNSGPALTSVTATMTSLAPAVTAVAGQGTLHFSPVPANGQIVSTNTFTILIDSSVPFNWSQLGWSFNNPSANPGPNRAVPALTPVTLDGTGSTNPGGIGSLTYAWAIQSAPIGSTAALSNANSAIATFTPDLIGAYVIALTVSNGVQADTSTVTISTADVPPTANAGSNQTVAQGATVILDGTQSSDVNRQPLTYLWSFVAVPPGSMAALFGIRSPTATFVADRAGSYIVGLEVNDGTMGSTLATVTVTTGNTPPVAVATATPQIVALNGIVHLDGSKSTDVDGNPLTYSWSLNTTQAAQSRAALSNPNSVNPTFTADVAGTYIAQLIVMDGSMPSQPVTVSITANSAPAPTANAGPNQSVPTGALVQLQGSGTDPGNLPLLFTWSLPTVPPGSSASLSATNIPNPTFVADLSGTYSAQLVVNNGFTDSSPSPVTISSSSGRPIAIPTTATANFQPGSPVSLSGAASYDPNNVSITAYSWSLSLPAGSSAALRGAGSEFAAFVPDIAGTYVAQLIVTDQFSSSLPATVSVSAGVNGIGLSPDPLNLSTAPQPITVTLSPGAGNSPVAVTLSGYDNTIVSVATPTITIPANASSATVIVTPLYPGNTSITASAPGYGSANLPVVIAAPMITLTFDNNATSVRLNQGIGATVTLSAPAPQTGTSVNFVDIVDHDAGNVPGLVTFSPGMVVIPPGATTVRLMITGALAGPVEILPSAYGYARVHVIPFTVTP